MIGRALIERLRHVQGMLVLETQSAWLLRIDKLHIKFEVTIPFDVLEWYVTAHNPQDEQIWQDWIDYTGYDADESVPVLAASMSADVERFVALLAAAEDFQVVETCGGLKAKTARWKQAGEWCDV